MDSIDLLVIQGTPFCNINCKYCYLPNRTNSIRIEIDTIKKIFTKAVEEKLITKNTVVVWHAGEPLAIPINYFEEIFKTIKDIVPEELNLEHQIQTNGTLINDHWCYLFKEYNISIGVSLDGPAFLNDSNRVTRKGEGTYHKTLKGIECLKNNNISFHVIAVVTKNTLLHAKEFYDFFINIGAKRLALNIEEQEGINESSSMYEDTIEFEKLVTDFYTSIYNLQIKYNNVLPVREFEFAKKRLFKMPITYYAEDNNTSQLTTPLKIVTIDIYGNFSTFAPELIGQNFSEYNNFIFGNVHHNSFKEIYNNYYFKKINEEIKRGIEKCQKSCDYFFLCGGGSPSNKFFDNGSFDSTITKYCKYSIQTPINIVLEGMEQAIIDDNIF